MEHPPSLPEQHGTAPSAERLAEAMMLHAQWTRRVRTLHETGFLSILPSHELGYKDADGKEHPVPTEEDIKRMLQSQERREFLAKKHEQGFIRLLLVPQKLPLSRSIRNYEETIARHRKEGTLLLSNGTKVTEPPYEGKEVWAWDEYKDADTDGRLIYRPREFSHNHGELTKAALPGWRILLTEDLRNLKRAGQGTTKGGRKHLETNNTPADYLALLQRDPAYKGEQGYDPETYIIDAVTRLEETNTVSDDDTYSYLVGAYFPSAGFVPGARWDRDYRRAGLHGSGTGNRSGHDGVRVSVGVGELP